MAQLLPEKAVKISAAKHILENFPDCWMLRRYPQPPPSNFEALLMAGKNAGGFEIKLDDGKALANSINAANWRFLMQFITLMQFM